MSSTSYLCFLGGGMLLRLCFLVMALAIPAQAKVETFYIGTYTGTETGSEGIYAGTINTETGKLGPIKLAAAIAPDPTVLTLSPDHRFLFAALGSEVASFSIGLDDSLTAINRQPSCGPNTCYVSLDKTGRELFATSYDDGKIAAFPVDGDGRIGPATDTVTLHGSGPNKGRQLSSHPHSAYVDPENRHLYVPDLGADRIWIFRLGEHGKLVANDPPSVITMPGDGPRHLVFSPDGKEVYVVNELGVSTTVYTRDSLTGALRMLDFRPNVPPGWPPGTGSAEAWVGPKDRRLYVSTRLKDFITVFSTHPYRRRTTPYFFGSHPLICDQMAPCPVTFPRSFAIDSSGRWLVVAGETDNQIGVMHVDATTGMLKSTAERRSVGRPVCILFAP
jgi:6-phosphogluconolactonase